MNAKAPYYGIAKTVMEIGYEIAKRDDDVAFVVFSRSHQQFLKVEPVIGNCSDDRPLRLKVSPQASPVRLRRSRAHSYSVITKARSAVRRKLVRAKWCRAAEEVGTPVNLDGQLLVSLSQPRILSDFYAVLKQQGENVDLLPLLHDMIPLRVEGSRKYKRNFIKDNQYILNNCQNVIANSEFTKSDIESLTKEGMLPACRDIFVVPLAHEFRMPSGGRPEGQQREPKSYFLTVGITPGRKNLEIIFEAMLHQLSQGRVVKKLVLAGARRKRILKMLDHAPYKALKEHVEFELNPPPIRLAELYKGAQAVLLPSFIEGWGLPAAESIWHNVPAIAADIPVLHEVLGDAGIFFDPHDATALAETMTLISDDAVYRAKVGRKIAEFHPYLRTWQRVAEDLIIVIDKYIARAS